MYCRTFLESPANKWNHHRSENARRPEAKTSPTKSRPGAKLYMRRERNFHDICKDICWRKTNLLTKKICLLNVLTKRRSADGICSQKRFLRTRNFFLHNLLKKRKTASDEKILKYLLKEKTINATLNVSLQPVTEALDVYVYGWGWFSVIYSKTSEAISGNLISVGTWDIPLTRIETAY